MATQELPFHLQGNFAPVPDEMTETHLEVEGAIPPELSGIYARNGSNPVTGKSEHWFLGEGRVHGACPLTSMAAGFPTKTETDRP
jgi:carotenoid cleavage dioxygenase-like enzyme